MSMSVEQLAEEALALPSDSRALLADRIVESLDAGELSDLDRIWGAEAKRRRDEVREGRVTTIPGEEAFLKVRRAVGRE
jgi:putative addiction module component (TIGR02574 family)